MNVRSIWAICVSSVGEMATKELMNMSQDSDWEEIMPRDDDYLWNTHMRDGNNLPIGEIDVNDDVMRLTPELEALEIEKRKLQIRMLGAQTKRHELAARRAQRETDAWDASADEHRIYNFFGSVDASSCMAANDVLGNWARRSSEGEFTIVFNSPGGSVIHGLALFDFVEEIKRKHDVKITTIARGMAASMGGVLLQAGNKRIVGSNAHVLIHEVSSIGMGKMSELEDDIKFAKRLQDRLLDILSSRSTLSKKQVETRWKRRDWWLNAQECVDLGFADEIG